MCVYLYVYIFGLPQEAFKEAIKKRQGTFVFSIRSRGTIEITCFKSNCEYALLLLTRTLILKSGYFFFLYLKNENLKKLKLIFICKVRIYVIIYIYIYEVCLATIRVLY